MTDTKNETGISRALRDVAQFSEKNVAVLPEKPGMELIKYLAQVTSLDADLIARLYDLFISHARVDKYTEGTLSGHIGFAEDK